MNREDVINVKNLKVFFCSRGGILKAVEGIDFEVHKGECVALVGESGCGKSVTGFSLMKLLQSPPAVWKADSIEYTDSDGRVIDIINADEKTMSRLRGAEISMIYQDPSAALNPVMTIGEQLAEVYRYHTSMNRKEIRRAGIEMLKKTGIPSPDERYEQYPHELSGGMKQRVLIAMAMACSPRLLIADEPTTALDVTTQAQITELLRDMCRDNGTALVMITHDLGVVREISDYMYVMYCGKIVEYGKTDEVIESPAHPYTRGLLESVPDFGERKSRFRQIPFNVPSPMNKPSGCYFNNRCGECTDRCLYEMPSLVNYENGRRVRCHLYKGGI